MGPRGAGTPATPEDSLNAVGVGPTIWPFPWTPQFEAADGRRGTDVLDLTPLPLRYSAEVLARELSPVRVSQEQPPACPWTGVRRLIGDWSGPDRFSSDHDLVTQFRAALSRIVGDDETVAVSFSGGLDSLAVLYHVADMVTAQRRRLLVGTLDLRADSGRSTLQMAQQLCAGFGLAVDVIPIVPDDVATMPEASWYAGAPRHEAMPRLNASFARIAAGAGATGVLTGIGGDELMLPRFALREVARDRGLGAARRYLADRLGVSGATTTTVEVAVASLPPRLLSTVAYRLVMSRDALGGTVPDLVAPPFRSVVEADIDAAARDSVSSPAFIAGWAHVAAQDQALPYLLTPYAPHDDIETRSPFAEPRFLSYVAGLPLAARYNPGAASSYHRMKGLTTRLFPESLWSLLPHRKETYAKALRSYVTAASDDGHFPGLCELGIVDARRLRASWHQVLAERTGLPHRLHALENWVQGADATGAVAQ